MRRIAFLGVFVLLFAMAGACSGTDDREPTATLPPADQPTATAAVTPTPVVTSTPAPTATVRPSPTPTATATPTPVPTPAVPPIDESAARISYASGYRLQDDLYIMNADGTGAHEQSQP
jgi:hypothetical protein